MSDFNWNVQLPLQFGQAESPRLHLARALPDDPQRCAFETFIQQRFRKAHGADIRHFMPELFGMLDANDALCAVVGVRLASAREQGWGCPSSRPLPIAWVGKSNWRIAAPQACARRWKLAAHKPGIAFRGNAG